MPRRRRLGQESPTKDLPAPARPAARRARSGQAPPDRAADEQTASAPGERWPSRCRDVSVDTGQPGGQLPPDRSLRSGSRFPSPSMRPTTACRRNARDGLAGGWPAAPGRELSNTSLGSCGMLPGTVRRRTQAPAKNSPSTSTKAPATLASGVAAGPRHVDCLLVRPDGRAPPRRLPTCGWQQETASGCCFAAVANHRSGRRTPRGRTRRAATIRQHAKQSDQAAHRFTSVVFGRANSLLPRPDPCQHQLTMAAKSWSPYSLLPTPDSRLRYVSGWAPAINSATRMQKLSLSTSTSPRAIRRPLT